MLLKPVREKESWRVDKVPIDPGEHEPGRSEESLQACENQKCAAKPHKAVWFFLFSFSAPGLAGGGDAQPGVTHLVRASGLVINLGAKATVTVSPGDRLRLLTPGKRRERNETERHADGASRLHTHLEETRISVAGKGRCRRST